MIFISQLVLKWWCLLHPIFLFYLFIVPPLIRAESERVGTICNVQGCNCTNIPSYWKVVNCTLDRTQELKLEAHSIPPQVVEIFISGGQSIVLSAKTFSLLPLSILHIDRTRRIVIENQSFYNITSASLLIEIQNCDRLIVKTGAFENVQTTNCDVSRCRAVSIEKYAFNRLNDAKFKDIPQIALHTWAFDFKGHIGKHGPVTVIAFDNVIIPSIPHETFSTSLAELNFKNTRIDEICNEAFSANTISAVSFVNSTITNFRKGAFIRKTLIFDFKISKCTVTTMETRAIMAAIGNLTVEHSRITDVESGAVNSTILHVEITGNEIATLNTRGFVIQDWGRINIDQNIIMRLKSHFIVGQSSDDIQQFSFNDNEVHQVDAAAFSIVPQIDEKFFIFENNFFEQTCHCLLDEWASELINSTSAYRINKITNSTFCRVNEILTACFNLTVDVMNVKNFTKLVCTPNNNTIYCEVYNGETKFVNNTTKLSLNNQPENTFWLTVIIVSTSFVILLMITSFLILLISKGGRWLKKKGYFRKIQYNTQHEQSNDEENTIVTIDETESENDKLEIPEELTIEYLQELSKKLDDPKTHQEASEMIEKLYEMFIIDDSYENNNRQDEEAHLYEELGNLQTPTEPPDQTRNILRLMEEKISLQYDNSETLRPKLAGVYSEPSDAAIHLYSELKQNKDDKTDDENNSDTLKSKNSGNMAFRPLPDKPGPSKI